MVILSGVLQVPDVIPTWWLQLGSLLRKEPCPSGLLCLFSLCSQPSAIWSCPRHLLLSFALSLLLPSQQEEPFLCPVPQLIVMWGHSEQTPVF